MLAAHLVPGYFAATKSRSTWEPEWNSKQRTFLWAVALGSTVAPDLDVVRNVLLHRFINHSVLWTHSIFLYLGLGLLWLVLHVLKHWPYLKAAVGLITVGGLSHLILDIVAHGTPLLYPVSVDPNFRPRRSRKVILAAKSLRLCPFLLAKAPLRDLRSLVIATFWIY